MDRINLRGYLSNALVLLLLFLPYYGNAQDNRKITIEESNIPIRTAFSLIEQQTGYTIAYEQSVLNVDKQISLSLKNESIENALKQILKDTQATFKIRGYHIIISSLPKVAEQKKRMTQNIKGSVKEESSEQPIPYASIILMNAPQYGTVTDSLGNFIINDIPIGRYDIKVSCLGYEPTVLTEIMVSSAKEIVIDVLLKGDTHLLDEVIVYPKFDKENALNPMALMGGKILTVEQASRFAGGFDDPARLVSSFAGVSSGINTNALVIRGNSPQFTQWRMEGVEIPNPSHYADMTGLGGGLLTGLSSNVLGNSDFFNSAFPAEYNNALAGIFDMNMRTGNNQNYEHAFQIGVWGLDIASEGPINKKQNSSYLFNYRYSYSGLADAISGAEEGLDYQDLAFKLNFPTKKTGTFTVWGMALLDKILQKNEDDPTLWEYVSDKQRSENSFTKGITGVGHKIFLKENSYIKSTLAMTHSKVHALVDQVDDDLVFHRMADVKNSATDVILTSYLNTKINRKHTNRTGVNFTRLSYDLDFNISENPRLYKPMRQISKGNGTDFAMSAFTNSVIDLNKNLSASIGLTGQYFSLNNNWTLEPRLGMKWKLPNNNSIGLAYGLNSTRERLDYYYVKTQETGDQLVNKNMDFSKSHHFSLNYGKRISNSLSLKIEPYYQCLFDIPVEANTSFSILNYNAYGLDKKLVNSGKGQNYGVDLTLERYLQDGWYSLFTGSLFKSEYMGGDNIWRNTRMDQRFILKALGGKEWIFGETKNKVFSANIRLTYQGGYRYTPIIHEVSENGPGIEEDITRAYSLKLPNSFTTDLTLRYKVNKRKTANEFAFMILNANGFKQTGYYYNLVTDSIEKKRIAPIVPSISWKIYF